MKNKCPICKGTGNIKSEINKKEVVKILVDIGYDLRAVQRLLGYKSPRSITKIIEKI